MGNFSMKVLTSEIDESVNFVIPYGSGMLEARYVRRQPDYFICYLSSQSGCTKGCAFCHLTTTKQTSFDQANKVAFLGQARKVFDHYNDSEAPVAKIVNFNWMARGEALDNPTIRHKWAELSEELQYLANEYDLTCRFNISTILPKTTPRLGDWIKEFSEGAYPTIYYSLYSVDLGWRERWLPGAMHFSDALDQLVEYQKITQKIVYIHGAFIKDQNDSWDSVQSMIDCIKARDLIIKWNIVRYNPFSPVEGEESPRLRGIQRQLSLAFGASNVQIVSRVGKDVHASCGTFFSGELYE